jgi:hypothetical protein
MMDHPTTKNVVFGSLSIKSFMIFYFVCCGLLLWHSSVQGQSFFIFEHRVKSIASQAASAALSMFSRLDPGAKQIIAQKFSVSV